MNCFKGLLIAVTFVISAAAAANAAVYKIDKSHSTIGFEVSHLVVSITKGEFGEYDGTINFDPNDPAATKTDISVQAASIDTKNADRDKHLKSGDFLDVEGSPTLSFQTKNCKRDNGVYYITGDLTIRGVTKEITFPARIQGPVDSPFGSTVIGIAGEVTIDRQDFGVSWNKALDQGGYVVGNDVLIKINIEAHQS